MCCSSPSVSFKSGRRACSVKGRLNRRRGDEIDYSIKDGEAMAGFKCWRMFDSGSETSSSPIQLPRFRLTHRAALQGLRLHLEGEGVPAGGRRGFGGV